MKINISGRRMEAAVTPAPAGLVFIRPRISACLRRWLLRADMGKETSIGFFFGLANEATGFKLAVEMHGTAVGPCNEFTAGREISHEVLSAYDVTLGERSAELQK